MSMAELDGLLADLGVDDPPKSSKTSNSESTSSGSSALNKWRIKTRKLIKTRRGTGEDDENTSKDSNKDMKSVLGSGFSLRKIAGWSSPSRTNKADLRKVQDIIESVIRATRAELSTEAVMRAVSQELTQVFKPSTWTEWFDEQIEAAYTKRESPKSQKNNRTSGINKSDNDKRNLRRRGGDFDEFSDSDSSDSEEDAPIRSNRSSRANSAKNSPKHSPSMGRQTPKSPKRQIVDDESDSDDAGDLASSPFRDFKVGIYCTVLPAADANSVSRDVRKLRKIKTQVWGAMQEKHGEQTGRVIGRNEDEQLVKMQFPQADLWFVYEALDITEDPAKIRAVRDALRQANAATPPSGGRSHKPNFEGAAASLAKKSMQRTKEKAEQERRRQQEDGDSDDDMRQHFEDTTEQVEEVTVTFVEGPLGMGFGWDGEFLEVFKFNLDQQGNKGQAEASESIMVGDLLVAVNDRPLSGLSKIEVIDILKTTARPMSCTFRGIPAQ